MSEIRIKELCINQWYFEQIQARLSGFFNGLPTGFFIPGSNPGVSECSVFTHIVDGRTGSVRQSVVVRVLCWCRWPFISHGAVRHRHSGNDAFNRLDAAMIMGKYAPTFVRLGTP